MNDWWSGKAAAVQQAVDNKDPNYQFAGYREFRQVFTFGHKPFPKLRDANGQLLHTNPERLRR